MNKYVLIALAVVGFFTVAGNIFGIGKNITKFEWDANSNHMIGTVPGDGTKTFPSVLGDASGAVPCKGCVGETLTWSGYDSSTLSTGGGVKAVFTINVPPGDWTLYFRPSIYVNSVASITRCLASIYTNSTLHDSTGTTVDMNTSTSDSYHTPALTMKRVVLKDTTTYYGLASCVYSGGSMYISTGGMGLIAVRNR